MNILRISHNIKSIKPRFTVVEIGSLKQETQNELQIRNEICKTNNKTHWGRL